jgi:hypothetical protein
MKTLRATGPGASIRRASTAMVFVGLAAVSTACGSSATSAAAPTRTVTATVAAPPATATTTPADVPSSSASAASGPGSCPTNALRAAIGTGEGAAGSTYTEIDFTNISGATCTLYGYPGVSLASGTTPVTQLGASARQDTTSGRELVTLAPGAVASALLRIVQAGNFPSSVCGLVTAKYLQVYPPNQKQAIYLSFTAPACSKPVQILTVSAVRPGAGNAG